MAEPKSLPILSQRGGGPTATLRQRLLTRSPFRQCRHSSREHQLRRVIGGISLGLGVALLVLGVLARPVLYDRLATVSLDQKSESVSEGQNMSALRVWAGGDKVSHYDPLTDVTLRSTRKVVGIPGEVKNAGGNNAFWQTAVRSEAVGIADLTYSNEGVSFDRRSGTATNCCGDFKTVPKDPANPLGPMVDEPVTREGLYFKFPFAVEKKTYKWWDGDLNAAADMKFLREESLFGTGTYVFQQVTPVREVAERDVPAGVFGKDSGDVRAKVMYGNVRTLWVEPNTGVIIKGQENLDKSLVSDLGTVVTTKGVIGYTDKTVRENASTWGSKGRLLGFIGGPLMPLGIGLGLLLGALGVYLLMSRREPAVAPSRGSGHGRNAGGVDALESQLGGSGRRP